jgi:large subunit ribosomal protein L25
MAATLTVSLRDNRGKLNNRRLRRSGAVPAILYGHGEQNVALAIPAEQLSAAVRHGARLVDLAGAVKETALIHDVQWDTYGTHMLHVDLARVSADETIELRVHVELRGTAKGATAGGTIEHLLHELEVSCRATNIPDKLQVNIADLDVGGEIKVSQLKLPEGVTVLDDPDSVVVQCVAAREETEEAATEMGGLEPEVIGRKAAEEGEGEE